MKNILLTDLHRQYDAIKNEIDQVIRDVIVQKSFIRGPFVDRFETSFARAQGVDHALGVGNGTDALYISLKTLGVGPGDEVITAANSFIATAEAVTRTGAKVVFADCDEYYGIDVTDVARKISPKTKVLLPVHLYGQMVDMVSLMSLAEQNKCFVVEDAAQAVLAEVDGVKAGHLGDFATFSFFPGKNLGAYGDAGALVTDDEDLFVKAKMYANHGRINKYDHEIEGINSRMDGIQGAILDVKLKYLGGWTDKRREVARLYSELLSDVPQVETPRVRPGAKHVFHIYPIRVGGDIRDSLLAFLKQSGINAGIHYPIALPNLRAYRYLGYKPGDVPLASAYSEQLISLPIFPELTPDEVVYITDHIKKFFKK